jgi:putative flippase GtrA
VPAAGKPLNTPLLRQFVVFGLVGTGGFLVDTATLYAALAAGSGPYLGRVASYLVAATFTWAMNRRYTFGTHASDRRVQEWSRFLLANAVGGLLNYGTYALLVAGVPLVRAHPVLGVAAGSLAGLGTNFVLSRRVVFRPH